MSIELQRRIDELSREIRAYPTPIARCDEQLTQLLEARAALRARLAVMGEDQDCGPDARWINDGGMHAA